MKPKTTKIAAILGLIVLTLSAGVMVGLLMKRLPTSDAGASATAASGTLSEQLQLTDDQQKRLRTIWETASVDIRDCYRQAQDMQKRRDQEIAAMMTEPQKAEFEKLAKRYADEYAQLTQSREQTFNQAVERTRTILDNAQRDKYDAILKSRLGRVSAANSGESLTLQPTNGNAILN